jgi:NADH dehydrogenase (ubiquinone) 1 alpha subcomplex subunit 5
MFSRLALRTVPAFTRQLKTSTGILGIAVHPDPLPALSKTYKETLQILKTLPDSAAYRKSTESIVASRLKIVEDALSGGAGDAAVEKVEQALGEGQIEQILMVAEDEHLLAQQMVEWKPFVLLSVPEYPQLICFQMGTSCRTSTSRTVGIFWHRNTLMTWRYCIAKQRVKGMYV